MTKDQRRIAWLREIMDDLCGPFDFHELASRAHEKRCGCKQGPSEIDYYHGISQAIDLARADAKEGVYRGP